MLPGPADQGPEPTAQRGFRGSRRPESYFERGSESILIRTRERGQATAASMVRRPAQ
jgi:hypothetical protein